jgi:biotin carboxyl carrier protein
MSAAEYRAEMVANVLTILVTVGQQVQSGDTLVMLESMKMEIPVFAESDGVVNEISVREGDVVQEGDVLVTVDVAGN